MSIYLSNKQTQYYGSMCSHKQHLLRTSGHEICADEHPDVPRAEAPDHLLPLGGGALRVHHVHVDAVVDQLAVQLLHRHENKEYNKAAAIMRIRSNTHIHVHNMFSKSR